jgi:hypothetical protein
MFSSLDICVSLIVGSCERDGARRLRHWRYGLHQFHGKLRSARSAAGPAPPATSSARYTWLDARVALAVVRELGGLGAMFEPGEGGALRVVAASASTSCRGQGSIEQPRQARGHDLYTDLPASAFACRT